MCDIWKANKDKRQLSVQDIACHIDEFKELGVRMVTLTGGEAMMNSNLWKMCEMLREIDIGISLMSTGLMLERHADEVVRWCDAVTVSLDGSQRVHNKIRRVPRAFERLVEGVASVKSRNSAFPVVGRCVLQRANFRDLSYIIHAAKYVGVDTISFLPADVSSEGFNRATPWDAERTSEVALNPSETVEFAAIVEDIIVRYDSEFRSGFINESPELLRRLPDYYSALNNAGAFPEVVCNAPWVSAVVEADQSVRPCYFQPAYGNLKGRNLTTVLNSKEAVAFRRELDVASDPVCTRCVCSLNMPTHSEASSR